MGILFGIMLIASLAYLFSIRNKKLAPHWDKTSIAFALAMASPVVAIFLSQAYHGDFKAPSYDWASRFLLAVPIYMALRQTNIRTITVLQYGFPIGALVGLVMLKLHPFDWGGRYTTAEFFNLIHFSDSALMLGFLSLFSIHWERKDHPVIIVFKLCGFAAGIYMSIQSGERGGWVAMPVLLLLWVIAHSKEKLWLKLGVATVLVATIAWLSYTKIDVMHTRIDSIFSDLTLYAQGNKDTSVGIRFQLYLAAIHLFTENPLFGVGPGGFPQAMSALTANGMVTPLGGILGTSEVHNEILHKCAETGIFGLVSILAIYLTPIFTLWKPLKASDTLTRMSAFISLCLILGFFIFGLTVEIFDLKMTATFFAFTLATLMAATTHHTLHQKGKILESPTIQDAKPPKIKRIFHIVGISVAPLIALVSLALAFTANNNNKISAEQITKANSQIEALNKNLLATQSELKAHQAEVTQEKSIQEETQKKIDEKITTIVQAVSQLQAKRKISPTLEEQFRQPVSAVTPATVK